MNDYLKLALAAVLLAGLGYAFGRYAQPARVEIKKEVEVREVESTKKNVVIVTHEEKRPDGTVITDSRSEDHSAIVESSDTKSKESTTITNLKPQWEVFGGAGMRYDAFNLAPVYTAGLGRRIIGPVFLDVYVNTSKEVGFFAKIEF